MNKIDIIHTPCKSCKFAQYDGDTQISCSLNKIEDYRSRGIEILEVYDDNKEFFVINKKKCLYFRSQEWYEKKNLSNIAEAELLVKQENELKYIAVIYTEPDTSIETFKSIVESLMDQYIKPKGLMIIREKKIKYTISIKDISNILTQYSVPWRLQNFIDEDMTFENKIKAIIKSAPVDRFYFLIYPSKYTHCNFIEKINRYIHDGNTFGCININDNLFFSYLTVNYAKNLKDINLLSQTDIHTKYETIN